MPGSFVILVGIDSDRELVGRTCRFENTLTSRARGVEDHFDALIVLAERELLPLAWILECVGGDTGVLGDHLAVGTDFFYSSAITGLELVDLRDVHPAYESHLPRMANERR